MAGRSAVIAFALAVGLGAVPPAWAAPSASCVAERAGGRALVQVSVRDLFDGDLLRLVQLGLVGRVQVEVTLYRRRRLWFDARRASVSRDAVVAWSRSSRAFALDGGRIADPQRLALDTFSLRPEDEPLDAGAHYVELNVRLEVLTARSLGQMAEWLVKEERQGESASGLSRTLVTYLASDLARTVAGRCPVQ
jgi:hypothetical protein